MHTVVLFSGCKYRTLFIIAQHLLRKYLSFFLTQINTQTRPVEVQLFTTINTAEKMSNFFFFF
jgi:hypothetical protein